MDGRMDEGASEPVGRVLFGKRVAMLLHGP